MVNVLVPVSLSLLTCRYRTERPSSLSEPPQPLVMHHCNPVTLGWCSLEEGRLPLQEWLGNGNISSASPKIAAVPQHSRAWRCCLDKSRREQQHMVNCLMPSGIFPAVFEELMSKRCFEGLSSELYITMLNLRQPGWSGQYPAPPGTSPLSLSDSLKR